MDNIKASQVVLALADLASKGKYDNVTPEGARAMNNLFVLVAELINKLEESESEGEEATEEEIVDDE